MEGYTPCLVGSERSTSRGGACFRKTAGLNERNQTVPTTLDSFEPSTTRWARGGKRAFEFPVAVCGLVVLAPVMLLAALAVKLTSRGPLFFSQTRVGKDGEEFRLYKFRSMRGGRTPDSQEIVPLSHPDITAVGRVIRRLKLDEWPQLVGVVSGRMSLVGPRPTLPDQVARYDEVQRRRLRVRPGLTGLAQVNGNTLIDWDERIRYDVYYVQRVGLGLDFRILCRTVAVLLMGDRRYARPFHDSPFVGSERL